jgi:hypothetical protein
LCINQTGSDEKNSQIPLMGEIYNGAHQVMVYREESQDNGVMYRPDDGGNNVRWVGNDRLLPVSALDRWAEYRSKHDTVAMEDNENDVGDRNDANKPMEISPIPRE